MAAQDGPAIVFGASGYTGRAVVAELRRRGIAVVAHLRPGSPRLETLGPEFEAVGAVVDTTPWDLEDLEARVAELRPAIAFGLLGITAAGARREAKRRGGAAPTYESVDFALTAMAIDACAAAGTRPRFVYLSSMGTSPNARGAYMQARYKAEQHLLRSGLPYTIVRPSFIAGDRDEQRPMESVGATVVDGLVAVAGALGARRLRRRFRSRTNTELASAIVEAALDPNRAGQVLESEDLG